MITIGTVLIAAINDSRSEIEEKKAFAIRKLVGASGSLGKAGQGQLKEDRVEKDGRISRTKWLDIGGKGEGGSRMI